MTTPSSSVQHSGFRQDPGYRKANQNCKRAGGLCVALALAAIGCAVGAHFIYVHGGHPLAFMGSTLGSAAFAVTSLGMGVAYMISRVDREDAEIKQINEDDVDNQYEKVAKLVRCNRMNKWAKRVALGSLVAGVAAVIAATYLATLAHTSLGITHVSLSQKIAFGSALGLIGAVPVALIVAGLFGHDRPQILFMDYVNNILEKGNEETQQLLLKKLPRTQLKMLFVNQNFHRALRQNVHVRNSLKFFNLKFLRKISINLGLNMVNPFEQNVSKDKFVTGLINLLTPNRAGRLQPKPTNIYYKTIP